jgi:hypothetical protein
LASWVLGVAWRPTYISQKAFCSKFGFSGKNSGSWKASGSGGLPKMWFCVIDRGWRVEVRVQGWHHERGKESKSQCLGWSPDHTNAPVCSIIWKSLTFLLEGSYSFHYLENCPFETEGSLRIWNTFTQSPLSFPAQVHDKASSERGLIRAHLPDCGQQMELSYVHLPCTSSVTP